MRWCWETLLRKQEGVSSVDAWESAEAFFDSERRYKPELLLVDLELPGLSGFEILQRMHREHPDTICIVLTSSINSEDVFAAIRAGASGYLIKRASPEELMQNIQAVVRDGMTFSPTIAKLLADAYLKADAMQPPNLPASIEKLTEREIQVLELIQQVGKPLPTGGRRTVVCGAPLFQDEGQP